MNRLDLTLDDMDNARFDCLYSDLIKQMSKLTQFNEIEVKCILMVYYKFVRANGPKARTMTKKQFCVLFKVFFNIYDMQIIERILSNLTCESKSQVDPVAWVKLFSIFLSTKLEPKMRFAFQVYNSTESELMSREVVMFAVDKFFGGDDEDELNELKTDMVDLIIHKFDLDRDGYISYQEYCKVVQHEPLYLEFLGTCIPSNEGQTAIAYCVNMISRISGE